MKKRGKFIVLYGVNNLGKTTQAKMLVEKLLSEKKKAAYQKYAVYELSPSGPMINGYLRGGNPFNVTSNEFQLLQVINRMQYQPTLEKMLENGTTVVAEDYRGTGIAWGIGNGGNPEFLKLMNSFLLKEDVAFLFTGKRFTAAQEKNHLHEEDDPLTERVYTVHLSLAREFGWHTINANRTRLEVAADIWNVVKDML